MTQTPLEWFLQTVESNQGLYQLVLNTNEKVYYREFVRISKEDYQFIYDTLLNNNKPLQLNPKSKIYAPKVTSVTSDRFKQYLKEKELIKTDNINDADVVVINKGDFFSSSTSSWYFTSTTNMMVRGGTYLRKPTTDFLEQLKSVYGVECTVDKDHILVNPDGYTTIYFNSINNFEKSDSEHFEFISLEGIELFYASVVRGATIIEQKALSNEVVKGTVIDDAIFESLKSMLSSSDSENHAVARKILYECDVDSSLYYIWQLTKVNNAFYRMHENRSKMGKAFVSNSKLYQLSNCSPSKFLDILKDKEQITQDVFERFKQELISQQMKILKNTGVYKYLHVEFRLNDELAQYTDDNPIQVLTTKKEKE
jgi:hypothetical protein